MNKGLEIWKEKHDKQKFQARTNKPEQVGVVCFANFRDIVHRKVNGKYIHPLIVKRKGLQIENHFYYVEKGEIISCTINRSGAKITKAYEDIPEWADELLIEKYNKSKLVNH